MDNTLATVVMAVVELTSGVPVFVWASAAATAALCVAIIALMPAPQ